MKRFARPLRRLLAVVLALVIALPALAAPALAAPRNVDPYNVVVTASDGLGVNIRSGPGGSYEKLREDPIPMDSVLTIVKEDTSAVGQTWGYTTYGGVSGWISMTEVTRQTSAEPGASKGEYGVLRHSLSALSGKAARAYLDIVDQAIALSGGYMPVATDPFADIIPGFAGGFVQDWDNNGTAELYIVFTEFDPYDSNYLQAIEQLWTWDGRQPVLVHEQSYVAFTYHHNAVSSVATKGGKTYLIHHDADGMGGVTYSIHERFSLKGDTLVSDYYAMEEDYYTAMDQSLREEDFPEFEKTLGGYYDDGTPWYEFKCYRATVTVDGKSTVYDSGDFARINARYIPKHATKLISENSGYLKVDFSHNGQELRQLLRQRALEDADPATLLGNLSYIGEREKCNMDADMAQAYVQAIRSMPAGDGYYTPHALLVDPAGDGYPLLVTTYASLPESICSDFTVWEYRDGKAVPYDFGKDNPGFTSSTNGLSIADQYLCGSSSGGGGVDPYSGSLYYNVSQARLTLDKIHLWDSTTNTHYIDGKQLPPNTDVYEHLKFSVSVPMIYCGSMTFLEVPATPASDAIDILSLYAQRSDGFFRYHKLTGQDDAALVDAIAKAVADAVGGEISAIYRLADGVYYVIITVNGSQQGALVQGYRQNGTVSWKVADTYNAPLSPSQVDELAAGILSSSNLTLDYSKLQGSPAVGDVLGYLQGALDNMDGVTPNDPAKGELAAFVESAVAGCATGTVTGGDNRLVLNADSVGQLAAQAQSARDQLQGLLDEYDITLNKALTILIRIVWNDMDKGAPCQITLDQSLLDAMGGCTVQLLLGDARHCLQLSPRQLSTLLDACGALSVQIAADSENTYTVNFLDESGAVLEQLPAPVTVILPASDALCTVIASYAGGSDNWGGQYDPNAGTLSFETRYSGRYEILRSDADISDISHLSEEVQTAIAFLVSKGYLSLEGDLFNPDAPLTRYDFTTALVGMFFALDRSLTTTFPDVSADSPYYPYVASGEHSNIVEGYWDGTFSGEHNITTEQMLALAARTLIERKGYTVPADPAAYLSGFSDFDQISDWAVEQVSMTVRDGLCDRADTLNPLSDITRAQAAVILYRLFLLLYEVPPVVLELPAQTADPAAPGADTSGDASSDSSGLPVGAIAAAAVVVAAAAGGAGFFFLKKKKPGA